MNEGTITNLNVQLVPIGIVSIESVDDEVFESENSNSFNDSNFSSVILADTSFVPYFVPDPNYQSIETTTTNDSLTIAMSSTNNTSQQSPEILVIVGAFDVFRRVFNQLFA